MNNVTIGQKNVFLELARQYDEAVFATVQRGSGTEIVIQSPSEAKALESFADQVCAFVLKDHPDYAGEDEGINADAALVANIVPRLVSEYRNARNPN